MLFILSCSLVLYGLMAASHASAVPSYETNTLDARATIGSYSCPSGTVAEADVKAAFQACKAHSDG